MLCDFFQSCLLACANWHHSGPSVTGAESVGRGLISCAPSAIESVPI